MENEKTTTQGGAREGAGRKRTLPEGTKPVYFALTEDEKKAVKRFIVEMRHGGAKQMSKREELEHKEYEIIMEVAKPMRKALRQIIDLYGGRGKGFRKAEEVAKFIGIVGAKDAVQDWENDNPNK